MSNCRAIRVSATFLYFKHELLHLHAKIYIENGSKIKFSPITMLFISMPLLSFDQSRHHVYI